MSGLLASARQPASSVSGIHSCECDAGAESCDFGDEGAESSEHPTSITEKAACHLRINMLLLNAKRRAIRCTARCNVMQ
jgi:hypothetical protein